MIGRSLLCLSAVGTLACGDSSGATDGGTSETGATASTANASTTSPTSTSTGETGAWASDGSSSGSDGSSSGGPVGPTRERLYVGTGEFDPMRDWHGIVRFDDITGVNSAKTGPVDPDGTINVKQSSDAQGVHLNFVHTIFVREDRDELYAGALFTTTEGEPCPMASLCGSVAVFAGASTLNGPQVATRSLFGPATTLRLPHGVWVDETRDILYVANTFAGSILVWDKASQVDGDIQPDRTITWQDMGAPVYIYVDAATDRAFVAAMPMIGGKQPQVLIYEDISTRNGPSPPNLLVAGPNTRLDIGNPTTHNTWFIAKGELLAVAHHTNEVLFYSLKGAHWGNKGPTETLDLAPRVLSIHEAEDDSDIGQWSAYGLFYRPEGDRMFVAAGYTPMGPPAANSDQHAVKVYEAVSDPATQGRVPPVAEIRWTNVDQYFPPQPLWVTRWQE